MTQKTTETIMLEPFTSIVSFDAISYKTNMTVAGAIGHYIYPDKEEYREKRSKFFASAVSRRNRQKISELVSEIYSYLNTKISEYADPRNYYFRIWVRIIINKKTGEILGHPHFDIDVYRHVGKVGGRHSEIGKYSMKVVFIGKERMPISSVFIKGVSKASQQSGVIDFRSYESYFKAPKEIREKITKDSPYLIIDEEIHKIIPKIDSKSGEIFSLIKEGKNDIKLEIADDVARYVLKKVKIKPEVIGSETAFGRVDEEIETIASELKEEAVETKTDLVTLLGVEDILKGLFKKLEGLATYELPKEIERQKKRHWTLLEKLQKEFTSLKVKYEVQEEELAKLEKDHIEEMIDEDKYRSLRMKRLTASKMIRTEMVELQKELKQETANKITAFVKVAKKEGKEKFVSKK